MREELLKGLTDEQIAKVKDFKTTEEILAFAKEEGIELTEEQLEAVSGGDCSLNKDNVCPKCGCNSCGPNGEKKVLADGRTQYTYSCWYCHNHYYVYD